MDNQVQLQELNEGDYFYHKGDLHVTMGRLQIGRDLLITTENARTGHVAAWLPAWTLVIPTE